MKIAKGLLPFLLIILAVLTITGCSHTDKTDVEGVITNELDLLKNLDTDTTRKYVSYKELFPDATEDTELSQEVKEVFSLFFKDFDYKIQSINVDTDKKEATASLILTTIDSRKLATDYAKSYLRSEILLAADSEKLTTEESTPSLEERYLLLNKLLKKNKYKTATRDCTITLKNTGTDSEVWEIQRTHTLENDLVGGLMTYLSDSDLLSPEDTLTVYLKTLKKMDTKQMGNYLGLESLMNSADSDKNSIASALVDQVHNNFDFKITSCDTESYTSVIETQITTFNSNAILSAYQEDLDAYLSSADAVIDGSAKRYTTSLNLLLSKIEQNKDTTTASAVFHLTNDGASWKLQDSNAAIGSAIFGTLSNTPVSQEEDSEE